MNDRDVFDALTIRELNEYDRKAALSYAKEKGEEEGRAKGLKTGRAEGLVEGGRKKQIEMAKKMLEMNMSKEQILEITGLTEEELKNIDNLE